ncbi:tRNA uridine(34) 5-carboxymethylaminomethyl modification radical SAM/GNAT enzyme Elp3 [Candidatus Micrarchaeota archaeon]|nr:tRNA uridine(34) 5-carboxymethylaminomethyl modification radical SAM/GNAT enzyme Elp3 [Candidatus Micrarchaeota archaeon]
MENAISYVINRIIQDKEYDLQKLKNEAAKKFSLKLGIRNSDIIQNIPKEKLTKELLTLLRKKPMRTRSGVTPIAVMIRPNGSCNYQCIYCPFTGKAAKSYTGDEPAALRSRQNNYDPYLQARSRIRQFEISGHPTDKCEVIVMGGTFLAMEQEYKTYFIKGIYDALNECESSSIAEAKKINETAKHRVIGLTVETRPDVCIEYIDEILDYGATRVELGVQHPNDDIYKRTKRGHLTNAVIDATAKLKDASFKVLYHIMPGLPGSNPAKDIEMLKRIFDNSNFRPDMLKIYPTLVIQGTELYNMMQKGEFEPYSSEQAADVISEFYRYIPKYVRVMRIQRDIPATNIDRGVKKSNLRELVEEQIRKKKIKTNEIRMREVGLNKADTDEFEMQRLNYDASNGKEVFLSFENNDFIAGFIRLRIPGESCRKEIDVNTALIRELHVYGQETEIKKKGRIQHKGLGSELLAEAEKIAKEEFDKKRMIVISGVGVREYYYKKGYKECGPYVNKIL